MNQREQLKQLIANYCNDQGNRTFTLQDLHKRYANYSMLGISGKTPQATVRRLLQELRDEEYISFLEKSGHYTLRGVELLEDEKKDIQDINLSRETPNKREYLIETYARSSQWVKQAKKIYGHYCLVGGCKNSFLTSANAPYIEVHHIVPLHQGGEDGIWNLSVLCAHHHKMAHFAEPSIIQEMQKTLLLRTHY